MELIATSTFGLEAVVSRELQQLGYHNQRTEDGRITFEADEQAISRCNLWLRSADRLLLKTGEFEARDFDELFELTKALPWSDWLPVDAEFPVNGKTVKSKLHHLPSCQSIIKKAIVDNLKGQYRRAQFAENGPLFPVEFSIQKDRITIGINTSGVGLHKRGYRTYQGAAPLKETLAAGLIQLSFWNASRPFIDPFCGTGTIPIEAAMLARNMAPGLQRSFASESWPVFPSNLWSETRAAAEAAIQPHLELPLIATDQDNRALNAARKHAQQAGVFEDLHIQQKPFTELTTSKKYGCLITNPPYGERVGSQTDVYELYQQFPQVLAALETWSIYILTAHSSFELTFGREADRRRKLYNGRIECTYYQFYGPKPPRKPGANLQMKDEND